jgi:hypothetical protein
VVACMVFRANFGVTVQCRALPIFKIPEIKAPVCN